MVSLAPAALAPRGSPALRLALRELRGGVRGFGVFIACIALGVTAIAGIGSASQGLLDGLGREGRSILGGDLSFTLIQREATADERAFLARHGEVSANASLRAMARTADDRAILVELKAVDGAYPLYGKLTTDPSAPLAELLARRGQEFGAVADPALFARLDLKPGAQITIGKAVIALRAALTSEPDKLAGGIGIGPRLMLSEAALRASGLLQPGSLVHWHYQIRLPEGTGASGVARVTAAAASEMPDAGWDVRTRTNANPQIARNIERFTQYLALVGLTALLIGGIGVANSTRHYLDRKRNVIATLKSLGATGTRVFTVYFTEIMLIAALGTAIGLALGAALPFALAGTLRPLTRLPFTPSVHPDALTAALAYGLLTAAAFALWPLGRVHDVPVSALFRDEVAPDRRWPRPRYALGALLAGLALLALAVSAAYDRRIALIFIAAAALVFVLLRFVAFMLMALARRVPRPRSTVWRLAIANIHRPGALTPTVVLSLGLGLALLVTVLEIDANLRQQFMAALPARAPSFYFLDIQAGDADRFDAFVRTHAPGATLERVPMLRGRIVAAGGRRAEDIRPRPDAQWVLHSDRGITYTGDVPQGSRVVAGQWWGKDYTGPPLLSFEKKLADGLGLKLGDEVTVNVLGRNVTARIANMRAVDWESLGINFVLVFSPGAFAGAPATDIATLTYRGGASAAEEIALVRALADTFPSITAVRVKDALDAVGAIVSNLVLAIRVASAVTLVAAVLVLGGALAAGHRHRVYDAVVLKTLGATRWQLITAYALEYLLIGLATALFGIGAGSLAAWRVVADVMTLRFAWAGGPAIAAALIALAITLVFGLIGTFAALGRKPAAVLRHL